MQPTKKQVIAGQAVYTKKMLSAYDIIVLGVSNRYIWKCPSLRIEAHYNTHLTANHLDVGVGTGYFLDRCLFPSPHPRVALMDMNSNALTFASQRIARYSPEIYQHNILEKIKTPVKSFDSVGVNYLFHCMPGSIGEKAVAFDYLKTVMNPDAHIFGSTILQGNIKRSWLAQRLMMFYNKKGIFANTKDNFEGLEAALSQHFKNVEIEIVGCVALFSAQA